eukprot:3880986-Rhodomonas_salina.1
MASTPQQSSLSASTPVLTTPPVPPVDGYSVLYIGYNLMKMDVELPCDIQDLEEAVAILLDVYPSLRAGVKTDEFYA